MEAERVALSDDDVRDRFSAYAEGDLPEGEREGVRARLEQSAELRKEYEGFQAMMGSLGRLSTEGIGLPRAESEPAKSERPSVLAAVQTKLHKRSGGKFYKNRFARRVGTGYVMEIAAAIILLLLVMVYLGMTRIVVQPGSGEGGSSSGSGSSAPK